MWVLSLPGQLQPPAPPGARHYILICWGIDEVKQNHGGGGGENVDCGGGTSTPTFCYKEGVVIAPPTRDASFLLQIQLYLCIVATCGETVRRNSANFPVPSKRLLEIQRDTRLPATVLPPQLLAQHRDQEKNAVN